MTIPNMLCPLFMSTGRNKPPVGIIQVCDLWSCQDFRGFFDILIMNSHLLLILLFLVCCLVAQGRVGFTIGSSLAVHKNSKMKAKAQLAKDLSAVKKIKKIVKKTEVPSETPVKSSLNKQKTLQTVMQLSFSLLSMFLSGRIRKLDYANKDLLKICRLGVVGYLVASYGLNLLLVHRIKKVNDQSIVERKVDPMKAIMNLMLNKPSKPEQSVMEYDLEEAAKMLKSLVFEVGMILVAHGLMKYNAPLLLIPMMQLSSKLQNPLVQIHLLGFKAIDTLQRPFQSGFERFLGSIQPVVESTDKSESQPQESSKLAKDNHSSVYPTTAAVDAANSSDMNESDPAMDDLTLEAADLETDELIESEDDADVAGVAATAADSLEDSIEVVDESNLDDEEEEEEESVH